MKNTLLAIVGSSVLGACSLYQVPIPDASKDMQQLDTAAQTRCARSGYQSGTAPFEQCVYGVKSQFLQTVMVPVQPIPDVRPVAPPPPPLQTHCYSTAGVTNCSTY